MPKPHTTSSPPGQRFIYWLAKAAQSTREQAGASVLQVAALAGVKTDTTIKRFERAEHWPVDPERFIAAYAQIAGINDPRDIYREAMTLWYEHGSAPALNGANSLDPRQRYGAATEQQARRATPPAAERTSSATRKKRAGS